MRTGIDSDMKTNIKEGYMIIEYKQKELFPAGEFDPDCKCRFFCHVPEYARIEAWGVAKIVGASTIMRDIDLSANDLWKIYKANEKGISSCAGLEYKLPQHEGDMLNLASDIDAYCGLD